MLKNISKKLKNKEKVTIVYFGASITQGAGIDDRSKCWRGQTTKWLQENYPESEIIEIDSSIGGTGSDLALWRIDNNVLKYNPDLVFVEFVVNDTILDECEIYEENIIRRILNHNLDTDIVLVRATRDTIYEKVKKNEYYQSYLNYDKMSKYYGIDLVDIGQAFFDLVDSGETFDNITIDGVHPNQRGYDIYASEIIKYLKSALYPFERLTENKYENSTMILAKELSNTNFIKKDFSFGRVDGCLEASEEGKYIECEFEGELIGVMYHAANDTGYFKYIIDDEYEGKINSWDKYCRTFNRATYVILNKTLKPGKHKIKIISCGDKCDESKGTFVRINAFLIS